MADDIEEQITAALREQADRAPSDAAHLVSGARRRAARRRRHQVVTAAAAVLVAVLVPVLAVWATDGPAEPPPTAAPTVDPHGSQRWRLETYGGVEFAVPRTWRSASGAAHCRRPKLAIVDRSPSVGRACPGRGVQVWPVGQAPDADLGETGLSYETVTLRGLTFRIVAEKASVARRVRESMTPIDEEDSRGCPVAVLPHAWLRDVPSGSGTALGRDGGLTVCWYDAATHRLSRSVDAGDTWSRALTEAVAQAPRTSMPSRPAVQCLMQAQQQPQVVDIYGGDPPIRVVLPAPCDDPPGVAVGGEVRRLTGGVQRLLDIDRPR